MNKYVNLTPHKITVRRDDGSNVVIPPDGEVLRVDTVSIQRGRTDECISINEVRPPPRARAEALATVRRKLESNGDGHERIVIVSGIALDYLAGDLTAAELYRVLSPDTSPGSAIREGGGRVSAVRAFRMAN